MKKKIIDLTHTLNGDISVYPTSPKPVLKQVSSIEKEGYAVLELTTITHNGTHIDAPCHIIKGGKTLDELPMDKFIGKAIVVSCENKVRISLEHLKNHEELISKAEFVLFYSGWGKKWNSKAYFKPYPALTEEAAVWLSGFKLKAVGFDYLSIDPLASTDLKLHKIMLSKEILIIENLNNLDKTDGNIFDFYCIPLRIENSDGSPVRAFGILK